MIKLCSQRSLFSTCTSEPLPGGSTIGTHVLVHEIEEANVAAWLLLGWTVPPLVGLFIWSHVFLRAGVAGTVEWTLKAPNGDVVASAKWAVLNDGIPAQFRFLSSDGFPAFLKIAKQSLIARYGPPGSGPALAAERSPTEPTQAPRVLAPARSRTVVVAVFDVQDSSSSLGEGTIDQSTEYLAAQLVEQAQFRIVPRAQLRSRLLDEKRESYQACFDELCQIELGKAVAAEKSLQTRLLRIGATCALTATLYDLRSETTEGAATIEGDYSENGLTGIAKRLAQKLAGR